MITKIMVQYGKSMYGGWYANFFAGEPKGIHTETKAQLVNALDKILGVGHWAFGERIDN